MYNNEEFLSLCEDILSNSQFMKLKEYTHHGITRYEHSLRVSYYTFVITKFLHLNYKESTRAALLHDFFCDDVSNLNGYLRLLKHPKCALENSKKYYKLSKLQEDIIIKHMFPVTFIPPIYVESYIVDFIDDVSAIYEVSFSIKKIFFNIFNVIFKKDFNED